MCEDSESNDESISDNSDAQNLADATSSYAVPGVGPMDFCKLVSYDT